MKPRSHFGSSKSRFLSSRAKGAVVGGRGHVEIDRDVLVWQAVPTDRLFQACGRVKHQGDIARKPVGIDRSRAGNLHRRRTPALRWSAVRHSPEIDRPGGACVDGEFGRAGDRNGATIADVQRPVAAPVWAQQEVAVVGPRREPAPSTVTVPEARSICRCCNPR